MILPIVIASSLMMLFVVASIASNNISDNVFVEVPATRTMTYA